MTDAPMRPIPKMPQRVSAKPKIEKKGLFAFLKRKKSEPAKPTETVKPKEKTISPYKEELVSEWKWLLKKLHIYDYESEEKNLLAYRKLRGWDK
jgi:hypothetical protein